MQAFNIYVREAGAPQCAVPVSYDALLRFAKFSADVQGESYQRLRMCQVIACHMHYAYLCVVFYGMHDRQQL